METLFGLNKLLAVQNAEEMEVHQQTLVAQCVQAQQSLVDNVCTFTVDMH